MTDELRRVIKETLDEADRIDEALRSAATPEELSRKKLNEFAIRKLLEMTISESPDGT